MGYNYTNSGYNIVLLYKIIPGQDTTQYSGLEYNYTYSGYNIALWNTIIPLLDTTQYRVSICAAVFA